ncbi:MAG: MFS transporter, partial [Deltaproteobacteria bacterium]|nr:MFS transporter [Deltaproteobacteria bacterium]
MLNSLGRGDSASRPRARILTKPVWALFFTNIFLFSSLNLLLTTMPLYLQDRGMSEGQIGFIFGGFYVACILMRLISGKFSRRLGEIRVLWIGLALTTLGNFLFLAFDSFINYFATRLLFGAGFGLATTLIISLASKIIPSHKLAEGLGYLAMGASLALAGGPMAGIKLNEIYGFKITMICVVTGLFLALLVTLTLRQKYFQINYVIPKAEKTKFSLPGKEITVPAFLTFLLGASCCGIFTYLVLYFDEMRLNGAGYFFLIATIGIVITRLLGGRI